MRIVCSFDGKDSTFDTDKRKILIGRSRADLAIDLDLSPDKAVSRLHALISADGSRSWIEDLDSTRGTLLNREEIKGAGRRETRPGDTIQVGNTTLRIESIDSTAEGGVAPIDNELPGDITETVNAATTVFVATDQASEDIGRRLALLYDLPLQMTAESQLDDILQTIVERLVSAIPYALHAALLVTDRTTGQALLKAYVPAGEPSVSLTLAGRAMERREGFIWRHGYDPDVTPRTLGGGLVESAMYAPLLWKNDAVGVLCTVSYEAGDVFGTDDLRLMVALAQYAAMAVVQRAMQEELRASAHVLTRLLTNFSPKVRDRLLASARTGRMRLGGQKSEVTILIADIRDFTRISASMDSDDVVDMLNDYFSPLVDVVFRFDGTVDKFIGDAMLVIFGSPEPDNNQHQHAVRAALEMQTAIQSVSAVRAARRQVVCDMGIGLHCGEVLHGFIGSNEHMEFTVIGDAVNRATRYCEGAGPGEIIISPQVHQRVWHNVESDLITLALKREGTLPAFRLRRIKGSW
jgi:adenylate cyclase